MEIVGNCICKAMTNPTTSFRSFAASRIFFLWKAPSSLLDGSFHDQSLTGLLNPGPSLCNVPRDGYRAYAYTHLLIYSYTLVYLVWYAFDRSWRQWSLCHYPIRHFSRRANHYTIRVSITSFIEGTLLSDSKKSIRVVPRKTRKI
jgi:hypothetical protein